MIINNKYYIINNMSKPSSANLGITAARTAVVVSVVIACGLLFGFLVAIRSVLFQLLLALILALALWPLMRWLTKKGLGNVSASIVTMTITLLVLLGIIAAIAAPLISQGADLIKNAPQLLNDATSTPWVRDLNDKYQLVDKAKQLSSDAPKLLSGSSSPILGVVGSAFSAVSSFFVVLFLTLFMLMEGPGAWRHFLTLLDKRKAAFAKRIGHKLTEAVGGYVNGNLVLSLIAGVFTYVLLLAFGVPYALALAALVAITDLIPLVGATIGTIALALVALTQGIVPSIIITSLMLVYQFVEGNILQPIIYGKSVRLSQLLILVATVIGGLLGGIVGVLISIPVAAAAQILIVESLKAINGTDITVPGGKAQATK